MGQVLGHSADKYVTGKLLQTSSVRRWSNLLVERWTHAAGELPALTPRDTEVAVLLNGHSLVDRIGSGMRQVTHGQPGTVWLCPSGITEEFINVAEPLQDCLHIFLPGQPFEETMLRDLDIDPKRVELRYEAIAQDMFINQIASQVLQELNHESASGRLLMETLGLRALCAPRPQILGRRHSRAGGAKRRQAAGYASAGACGGICPQQPRCRAYRHPDGVGRLHERCPLRTQLPPRHRLSAARICQPSTPRAGEDTPAQRRQSDWRDRLGRRLLLAGELRQGLPQSGRRYSGAISSTEGASHPIDWLQSAATATAPRATALLFGAVTKDASILPFITVWLRVRSSCRAFLNSPGRLILQASSGAARLPCRWWDPYQATAPSSRGRRYRMAARCPKNSSPVQHRSCRALRRPTSTCAIPCRHGQTRLARAQGRRRTREMKLVSWATPRVAMTCTES